MTKVNSPKGIDVFEYIPDTDVYASMYIYQLDTWNNDIRKEDIFNNNRLDVSSLEIYNNYEGMSVLAVVNRLKADDNLYYTSLNAPEIAYLQNVSVRCTK